jgi:hypothetical protein
MRILLAFRVFFQALFNSAAAQQFQQVIEHQALPAPSPAEVEEPAQRPASPKTAARAARSEALTLLAVLQREARFVDLVKEPLANYADAQIGAAAREVLRDCGVVLERMFALQPLSESAEGSEIEVPRGYDPLYYRITGNVVGEPPYRGKMVHPGWVASRCELPAWTGDDKAAGVIAPQEVELD